MKFYIFSSDTPDISCSMNQAVQSSEDYYETKRYFDRINSEYRYNHSYLVADFGTFKPSSRFSRNNTASLESINMVDDMPFLIIAEFHYNPDTNECNVISENGKMDLGKAVRKDMITLKSEGFSRTFYNNESALKIFLYYIDQRSPLQMFIKFKYRNKEREVEMERFVASSISVMRSKKSFIDRIELSGNPYGEIEANRKFYNYELKEKQALIG